MSEGEKRQFYIPPDVPTVRTWTVDGLREAMTSLGKSFTPADEIKDRLEGDLTDGALILFTREDVVNVVQRRVVPKSYEADLIDLVESKNDVAVIPGETALELEAEANPMKFWAGH